MHGNHHDLSTLSFYFILFSHFLAVSLSISLPKNHENEKKMYRTWLVILKSCTTKTRPNWLQRNDKRNKKQGKNPGDKENINDRQRERVQNYKIQIKIIKKEPRRRTTKMMKKKTGFTTIKNDRDRRRETSNEKIRRSKNEKYLFKVQINSVLCVLVCIPFSDRIPRTTW